jgi:hypothetical protein
LPPCRKLLREQIEATESIIIGQNRSDVAG